MKESPGFFIKNAFPYLPMADEYETTWARPKVTPIPGAEIENIFIKVLGPPRVSKYKQSQSKKR